MKKILGRVLADTIKSICPFMCVFLYVSSFALPTWWARLLVSLFAAVLFFWYKWAMYSSYSVYHVSFVAKEKDSGECTWCEAEYWLRCVNEYELNTRIRRNILSNHLEFEDIMIVSINKLG